MAEHTEGNTIMNDWITTAEAARRLGVSQRRIRQLVDGKELEGRKVHPRLLLVKKESIAEYLASR